MESKVQKMKNEEAVFKSYTRKEKAERKKLESI